MLSVLVQNILPVFSALALGFLLGKRRVISAAEASTVNRIAFLVLQPALIFPLINQIDFSSFEFGALAGYVLSQIVVFATCFWVCNRLLSIPKAESWLLSMATVFVNSLLYIYPISILLYGETANLPIAAIVAWDSTVSFGFFIISTDLIANQTGSFTATFARLSKNPVLWAIAAGLATNFAGLDIAGPLLTACHFMGPAAAPLTLLALGVILAQHALRLDKPVFSVIVIKLIALPAIVWVLLQLFPVTPHWQTLFLLNAAGPSGAMAFALAMLHNIRTDRIARVIIWTSILSLISLAGLA